MQRGQSRAAVRSLLLSGVSGTVAMIMATAAQAQDGDLEFDPEMIEEMVITAQKREKSSIDVPFAVTVFSDEFFKRTEVETFDELSRFTPNLFIEDAVGDSFVSVTLRGIGSDPLNQGIEPSVAVVIDGVFQARPLALNSDIVAVDRVEVLRGPQGTLFGKNATAGVINITTHQPTREREGFADILYANFDQIRGRVSLSGPISETLSYSISGFGNVRDSYAEALQPDIGSNRFQRFGVNGKLLWSPTPELNILLNVGYNRTDSTQQNTSDLFIVTPESGLEATAGALLAFGLTDQTLLVDPLFDRVNNQDFPGFNELDRYFVNVTVDYDLGSHTLTSITGFSGFDDSDRVDVDFTALNILNGGSDTDQFQVSQEIRLQNNNPDRLDYTVGFYYFYQDLDDFGQNTLFEDGVDILSLPSLLAGGGLLPIPPGLQSANTSNLENNTFAVFGEATYKLTDRLSVLGGLRFDVETRDFTNAQSGELALIGLPTALDEFALDRTEFNVAGRFSLQYSITEDVNSYFTFSRAVKSGSFNVNSVQPAISAALAEETGLPVTPIVTQEFLDSLDRDLAEAVLRDTFEFEEETGTSFEVGLKGRFLDGRLTANFAGFYAIYDDLQVSTFDGNGFFLDNAARAETYGVEIDFQAIPYRGATIYGGFGFNIAEFDSFTDADCTIAQILATPDDEICTQDLSGESLAFVPEFSGSFGAQYLSPEGFLPLGLQVRMAGDFTFRTSYFTASDLDPNSLDNGYLLSNFKFGLLANEGATELAFFIQNAFDEDYLRLTIDQPLFDTNFLGNPGEPRTFGVVLRQNF